MDTATPPGPVRLFDVDPGNDPLTVIIADPYRVVLTTDALAAAAYSAGAEAIRLGHAIWITSPDRWHATVTRTDIGWHVDGSAHAPTDAIRRALTHITTHTGATQ